MLHTERRDTIIEILKTKDTASIHELVELTGASEATVRRDLSKLESDEQIKRIHGGASLSRRRRNEPTIAEKSSVNQWEKKKIAEAAASLLEPGECLFLDAGTTTLEMIPYLADRNLVVVTNGIPHVPLLLEKGIETYVIGGKGKQGTGALVGIKAIEALKEFCFDACFLGINGVHPVHGYTTPDPDEAVVKRTALDLAERSYVLADHSKINSITFANIGELALAEIITSDRLRDDERTNLKKYTDVKVVST
ncbi:DeoR/GlpR transcriptional regulator [Marinococcus halophilus]|uniref:DeoR family transcriptional regulator n=1 Tax=Marinococcus halophilus TaxID=1371 RepID=A0A510YA55_MARHA|nr:DeoR/GlpR family DNA-binding transcription regulator [Marinococcus halophilus]OZT79377.1 DeoR/GlpR transcriptional regulator [Marinococcus halophilus]GEK59571.1 DeoR family transcriptional regulator [Marinococcus halophilus]